MMEQDIYTGQKVTRFSKCVIIYLSFIMTMILAPLNAVNAQSYKENTGWLLQKVEPLTHYFFIPFKHGLVLPYFYGYYIVSDEVLWDFFERDSVNNQSVIMLCDPASIMFADSATSKEVKNSTRIKDILLLDDSEIYEIGGGKYIIRKIRYAYYDNSQVKVYIKSSAAYMWDDIQDEDTAEFNAIYEVGELYKRDYYQCYHHLLEIIPSPPQISKHIWRRLYQMGEKGD